MKKKFTLVITLLVVCLGLYTITHISYAQERSYTLLAPLPLEEGGGLTQQVTFTTYVNGAFRFVLGVAGILAVIMIIYAGFTYMTTDAFQKKEAGREIISNAVKGLLLAIGTWIIINTINPKLLQFNLIIPKPTVPTTANEPLRYGAGSPTCPGCTTTDNLPVKQGQGNQVTTDMATKLNGLNAALEEQGLGWMITEAYPPTRSHRDPCHTNGTCIDADILGTNPTVDEISRFAAAAEQNNLCVVWETKNSTEAGSLRSVGINVLLFAENSNAISGSHFSVYNDTSKCN